ncbi:hypothetical protein CFC21_034237 [Triticum aestivum]|uniref:Uncharacterized protein n=4 Tax=Triticum TaxID=4564 RepID=A0A9R0RBK8_TRITD|nr:uncharacterized protein LOC119271228 [Triticum dicoccoides]XP_044336718.1 uncharacterized protein LOC123057919 [Triticum aestivum]XP_048567631.1 uncharacterized protein LOC125547945 [Triticum urartu]KAF7021255.1 hypothetical protein CFC21_034237 [Triticum aestivum]VAH57492.1 unnamed protein product [Triticum turgidum subsp. durum]
MGNSLRCCLACVLPCGALDLVRIVHLSGRVDEYGRAVLAGEVLAAHPNHVLSRPCGSRQQGGPRIVIIVSPEAELERGEIYFLLPAASVPADAKKKTKTKREPSPGAAAEEGPRHHRHHRLHVRSKSEGSAATAAVEGRQQQQQQHRRRMSTGSHATSWHPHLARIAEDP